MSWTTSPLIGRSHELLLMNGALERAASGRSVLVEVAAEAGYGKSRLVEEAVSRLPTDQVLLVACYEDDHRPYSLVRRLGSALERTVRPLPVDWDAYLADSPFAAGEVLGELLEEFASARLGVVVLEDLHWADILSMEALVPLGSRFTVWARDGARCRLALVITYRPFELTERAHTIMSRLSQHAGSVVHTSPQPLGPLDVNALVIGLGFGRPSGRLLHALVDASAGNPLHIQSVMARLETSGRLRRVGNMVDFVGAALPADLSHDLVGALQARLKVLPDEDTELLGLAALLDPPVDPERLAFAAGVGHGELRERLRLSEEEGLVQVDDSVLVFRHPLLRSVLARRLAPTKREGFERRIADVALASPRDGGLVSAGRHLSKIRRAAPADLVADICRRAAEEASRLGDYGVAADLAEAALDACGRLGDPGRSPDTTRLHHLAAVCHFRNHDREAWRPHSDAARAAAVHNGDLAALCEVELLATRAEMTFGPHPVDASRLDALLLREAELGVAAAGRVRQVLAEVRFGAGEYEEGAALAHAAVDAAQLAGTHDDEAAARFAAGLNAWAALDLDAARGCFETCERLSAGMSDRWLTTWGLGRLSLVRRMEGRFEDVLTATAENSARGSALGDWTELALAAALRVSVYAAYGDLDRTTAEAKLAEDFSARGEYVWAPTILLPTLAGLHAERGDAARAAALLDRYRATGSPAPRPFRQLVAAHLFDRDALRAQFAPRRLRAPMTAMTLVGYCGFAVAATELGEAEAAAWAVEDLVGVAEAGVLVPIGWNLLVPRVLGGALRASGRPDDARDWLLRAAERGTLCGALPEVARTFLELARVEADRAGDRAEARKHVGRAVAMARHLGMAPLEAEATRLGLSLGRFDGDVALLEGLDAAEALQPLLGAVMFTDIVDSTRRSRALRDIRWVKVLAEHDRRLRACLARFEGVEFTHTGDGIGAYFASARSAVECALAVHETLREVNAADGAPLPVRIGICWGEATPRGRDLAGSTVSRCVRVMSVGGAGDTTMDEAIADAARGARRVRPIGSPGLKGFEDERHILFQLASGPEETSLPRLP
jgi:class 3 adenylate cyclase